jgi:hypothetical protein
MSLRPTSVLAAALLLLAPAASQAALASYSQNFETLTMADPNALASDGWIVYGNVFTAGGAYVYGYGTFPAPNGGSAFCSIDALQGGDLQGLQQLSVYSDYNNTDHALGRLIESNVFQERTIGAADLHTTWTFQFDAKMGNLVSPTKALAFIKTIDPLHGYAMTNFINLDMAVIPGVWNTYTISIPLDSTALVGQFLQFGFNSTASLYVGSGVFYDNITFLKTSATAVGPSAPSIADLRPASPNPFSNSTRIDYSMAQAGSADLTVYDVTGRRVATLFHGEAGAGPHSATWTGLSTDGRTVPAGVYNAVLQTATGRITHRVVFNR